MRKFEIKLHNGPGRFGKIEELETPTKIIEHQYTIAENEAVPYDVQKEISVWSVKSTLNKAKKHSQPVDTIGIIQGSKYVDLRIKCGVELENIGYKHFLIANCDDLLLHPKDLVNIIVKLRENLKPNSFLIFSFAEASFIPLLAYMGIDGFLNNICEYYAYLNVLMTPTKNYDLNKYKLYDFTFEELKEYNENTLDFVLKEVKEHMQNGTLRNLVEERSNTSPQNISALKILDKNHQDYLQKYTEIY